MADNLTINEVATWPANVHLIDTDEPVIGGIDGVSNKQAIALANRTKWLKAQIDAVITGAMLEPDPADLGQLAEAISALIAASKPGFDIPFLAGWDSDFSGEDLAVKVYGRVLLSRDITIQDFTAELLVAATGSTLIFDIKVNDVSVFTTLPQFADGSTALTPGALDPAKVDCSANDILTFEVTQIGSTIAGQKVTAAIKGKGR